MSSSSGSTRTTRGWWLRIVGSVSSPRRTVPVHLVEVDGVTHRVSRDEGGLMRAPSPALVVATPVAAGAEVEAGAPVLVLESMKMETVLHAPFKAIVKRAAGVDR